MPTDLLSDQQEVVANQVGSSSPQDLLTTSTQPDSVSLSGSTAPVIDQINALGGGAQETLANSIGKAGGMIADFAGQSMPRSASNLIRQGSQGLANALQPPDFVKDAQEGSPSLSNIGNAVGGAMAMGATGAGATQLAAKGIISAESAPYLANMAISSAMSGDGLLNRTIGAAGGAVITKAASILSGVVGEGMTALTKSKVVGAATKALVGSVNNAYSGLTTDQAAIKSVSNMWNMASTVRDKLYEKFTNTMGSVRFNEIARLADNHIEFNGSAMTSPQKGAFDAISKQADSVRDLKDAHEFVKAINNARPLFYRSGTAPQVITAFKDLQSSATNMLTSEADRLGAGADLALARTYNREVISPLQDFGADKIARGEVSSDGFLAKYIKNPTGTNPNGTPESLGRLLESMDDTGKEVVVNNFIQRAIQTSKTGADGLSPEKGSFLLQQYLNNYGKYLGRSGAARLSGVQKLLAESERVQSSAAKATFGLANRIPILGSVVRATELLGSKTGQKVLEFMGSHPNGTSLAKTLISGVPPAASAGAGALVDTYRPTDNDNQ